MSVLRMTIQDLSVREEKSESDGPGTHIPQIIVIPEIRNTIWTISTDVRWLHHPQRKHGTLPTDVPSCNQIVGPKYDGRDLKSSSRKQQPASLHVTLADG